MFDHPAEYFLIVFLVSMAGPAGQDFYRIVRRGTLAATGWAMRRFRS